MTAKLSVTGMCSARTGIVFFFLPGKRSLRGALGRAAHAHTHIRSEITSPQIGAQVVLSVPPPVKAGRREG